MTDRPLVIRDDDRYSRLELIGWWDQDRLRRARILVAGAGALGNEVLKNLALVGVGEIVVIDFDRIENSNLSRSVLFRAEDAGRPKAEVAAESVRRLNPDVAVRSVHGNLLTDIGQGLVREMDLVIGCLDNREARLWINRLCWHVTRPWIDGGIQEINGVVKVFVPPGGACYECAMTENDYRLMQLRYSCPLLQREDMQQGKVPTAPTVASMIAGLQVQEALKLLHGIPVESGAAHVFNGIACHMYTTHFQRRDDCLSHDTRDPVIEGETPDRSASLSDVAGWLQQHHGVAAESLMLDRDLVTGLRCDPCAVNREVMRPRAMVSALEAVCERCGQPMAPEMEHVVPLKSPLARIPLAQLGIPDQEILHLTSGDQSYYVQLAREPGNGAGD